MKVKIFSIKQQFKEIKGHEADTLLKFSTSEDISFFYIYRIDPNYTNPKGLFQSQVIQIPEFKMFLFFSIWETPQTEFLIGISGDWNCQFPISLQSIRTLGFDERIFSEHFHLGWP